MKAIKFAQIFKNTIFNVRMKTITKDRTFEAENDCLNKLVMTFIVLASKKINIHCTSLAL